MGRIFDKRRRFGICFLGLLILIGFVCYDFFRNAEANSSQLVQTSLLDNARNKATNLSYLLEDNFATMETLAMVVAREEDLFSDTLHSFLETATQNRMGNSIGIADLKGNGYRKGEGFFDVSDRDYYKEALLGERSISSILISRVNGKKGIAFAVPINKEDETIGVLWDIFGEKEIKTLLRSADTVEDDHSYIITKAGHVIVSKEETLMNNDFYKNVDFLEKDAQEMKAAIQVGKEGYFRNAEGNQSYCSYVPIPNTSWYYVSINNSGVSLGFAKDSLMFGIIFMVKMLLVILMIAGLILLYSKYKNRQMKQMLNELMLSNQRYRIIVNQMEAVLIEFDIVSGETVVSDNFEEMFGRPFRIEENWQRKEADRDVYEEDRDIYVGTLRKMLEGSEYEECECRIAKGDGTYIWCLLRYYTLEGVEGNHSRFVCKISNIDKIRRRTEDLERRAQKDPLTGLYNKAVTKELIEEYLLKKPDTVQILIIIDIDDFKQVNDNYGHLKGDQVIIAVGNTLQSLFRKSDIIGRIGGDEFIVCMKDCSNQEYGKRKVMDLAATLKKQMEKENLKVTCSIGAALYPEDGDGFKELFEKADLGLYQAKRKGKNQCAFYEEAEKGQE